MPRYEYSEGSSNKFWEITLQGNDVVTRYGRIGAEGQSTTKSFKDAAEAKHAYDKLIAEKTKKGYVAAGGAPTTASTPAPDAPVKTEGSLVARLDQWMKTARATYCASLGAGASADEIAEFEKELGAQLPQTLKELLMWRSGDGSCERFVGNWALMSLKSIAGTWKGLKKLLENGEFEDREENWWNTAWVPFLENGGGDNLCIDVKGAVEEEGAVICFWHDDSGRAVEHNSLDAMLEDMLSSLEAGNWDIDDNGFFEYGPDYTPSERAKRGRVRRVVPPPPAEPPKPARPADPKTRTSLLLTLPERNGAWTFKCDISPDGKHTVYTLDEDEKSISQFVFDGKTSPSYENLNQPWFDNSSTLVFSEGKRGKRRWHIGEQVHDAYTGVGSLYFSPDGKHHCYMATKGKKPMLKWMLVVDGKPQKETYESAGQDLIWSPDGTKIAYVGQQEQKKFIVNNGERGPDCLEPYDLVFSPDGSQLAYRVRADQPILQYHVICGSLRSEKLDSPPKPGFTPKGELWYGFRAPWKDGRNETGIRIGDRIVATCNTVQDAFFLEDGTLAAHIEYGDGRKSYLVRANGPRQEIGSYHSTAFHPPDTFAIVMDNMTPRQAMVALASRMVVRLNGRESEEYDLIMNLRFSSDGKTVTFGAVRDRELWWVEMVV
jgi:predicted DNA-binding WGR domain protein/cell wall assembly regulator SMI1